MQKEFLTIEEQFKETLNNEQIKKIQDPELREIRMQHWEYRHKIFIDERNISDVEFVRLSDADYAKERGELNDYCKRKGLKI